MPHGIVVASLAAALYALSAWGAVLLARTPRAERGLLAALAAAQLPMSALAWHTLRVPLDALVRHLLGPRHPAFPWVALTYAPLTEEPAKLLPLALPWVRARVTEANAERVATALGLGFGAGEAVFVAVLVAPHVVDLPWWHFGAFMLERVQVALVHGLLTRASVLGVASSGAAARRGLVTAMALHLALNLPVLLAARGWFGDDRARVLWGLALWVTSWWAVAWTRLTVAPAR